jgi:hypothetical protein
MTHDNAMSTSTYWTQRDAQMDYEIEASAKHAQSYEGRLETAQRRFNIVCADRGRYTDADVQAAIAVLDDLKAEESAMFVAEWTPEVTATRRAEWNAFIATKPKMPEVGKREWAQGWTLNDLKRAVNLHK